MLEDKSDANTESYDRLVRWDELAGQLALQGRFQESAVAIERLFAGGGPQDKESARLLDPARRLFVTCQEKLAEQNHPAAAQAVAELQSETQKLAGYPIRVALEDDADVPDGWGVMLAWEQGCGQHLVVCQHEPEHLQTYHRAAALVRIQTESEARRAGTSRVPTVSARQKRKLLFLFDPQKAQRFAAEGIWITANPHPDDIALEPIFLLFASAPWMLADARLRERYPVLRPAQFLARCTAFHNDWQAREQRTGIPPTQRFRERTINALDGLQGLFLDSLFGGVTDFATRCRDLDGFDLSQKLWQHWQTRSLAMQPGDEFAILDHYAEILGLSGRFGWKHQCLSG